MGAAGSAAGSSLQEGLMAVGASSRDPLNTLASVGGPRRARDSSARAVQIEGRARRPM
jgi:hypothetical protein